MAIYSRLHKGENATKEYESQLKVVRESGQWIKIVTSFNCTRDCPIETHLSPQDALQLAIKLVNAATAYIKPNSQVQVEDIAADDSLQFATKLIHAASKHVHGLNPSYDPNIHPEYPMRSIIRDKCQLVPFDDPS